ncbi:hypothetical protein ACELLULO517_02425 [Acidisoma cellulosilytica]|uniref:Lipocalin-like domain-containing protein n=1 Tax=Acidisoma cellulosilyticum TaxID=2802395 RepID=A0A964E2A1_9PROT|nr:hypothetical protein [Acidisoma cellulosilyticum]MCB8879074.1 hypothetical protein [Acidisoma cellulosilyticum]
MMRLVIMAVIACTGLICATVAQAAPNASASLTQPEKSQSVSIPTQLLGTWKIYAVAGSSPMFLQVDDSREMIGREIKIEPGQVSIWNAISGKPISADETTGTLTSVISEPGSMKKDHDFPDSAKVFDYVSIGLSHCASNGTPVPQGCPFLYFALNSKTGAVSFVPFAWGMAYMTRIGD